jgi:rare lipoprotein A
VCPSVVRTFAVATVVVLGLTGCASSGPQHSGNATVGVASYYAAKFQGCPTASGERFDNGKLTAAHRTLPFGTKVRVTNLENGRSVTVRVNDRGPFVKGRVIDLSYAAAQRLEMVRTGVARVRLEPVGGGGGRALSRAE